MIFSMISEVDSIIYVPKDHRKKVDVRHLEAHHFHDLLLVSKKFITSEEFAFAILNSAKLKFYSYNELRRLVAEVPRSFKENIRSIEFSRTHSSDDFKNFSNIETTLANDMPRLRQIYISSSDHCAQVGRWSIPNATRIQTKVHFDVAEQILSEGAPEDTPPIHMEHMNSLTNVAASFIGNRDSSNRWYRWTRPIPWIRRLVQYAETNDIEVIFRLRICFLCIAPRWQHYYHLHQASPPLREVSTCWSSSALHFGTPMWRLHLEGEMSSKDFIFRVEHDDCKYAFHQQLAYDLLHGPNRAGQHYWHNLVAGSLNPSDENDGF